MERPDKVSEEGPTSPPSPSRRRRRPRKRSTGRRLPKRPRPPASNAEVHAWNYGRRIAEDGHAPPSVIPCTPPGAIPDLWTDEVAAWERLGFETFTAWALRGWWAAHTSKERE